MVDGAEKAAAVTGAPPCYALPCLTALGVPADNTAHPSQHAFRPGEKIYYNGWQTPAMPEGEDVP